MCLGPRWITHLCKTFNISRRCQYTEGVNAPTVQLIKCSKLHIVSKAISTVRDFNYRKKKVLMISSNCYLSFIRSVPLVCISLGLERALPAGKVHSLYLQPKKENRGMRIGTSGLTVLSGEVRHGTVDWSYSTPCTHGLPLESTVWLLSPRGQPDGCIWLGNVKVEKSPRKSVQS